MSAAPALGRLFWTGAALIVALVGLLQLGWLAAYTYDGVAREQARRRPDSAAALAAAQIAARLAPWEARFHLDAASGLAHAGRSEAAADEVAEALRWVSADANIWTESSMLLAQSGLADARLLTVTQRAIDLAPATRDTQTALALSGLRYWDVGNTEQRAQWRRAIRFSFEHDQQRLLRDAVRYRLESRICGNQFLGLAEQKFPANWCVAVNIFRGNCIRDDLTEAQRIACAVNGYRVQPQPR